MRETGSSQFGGGGVFAKQKKACTVILHFCHCSIRKKHLYCMFILWQKLP